MSSRVKTVMPFINKEILRQALTAVGCNYTVDGNTIITDRKDYTGTQQFEFINGRFAFVHEANDRTRLPDRWARVDKPIQDFLARLEREYDAIYRRQQEELRQRLLEAERLRVEAERRQAEAERKRLEAERQRAEAERKRLEAEKQRADEEQRRQEEEERRADEERRRMEEEGRRAEEELLRLEEERRTYVEIQRQTVIANAKAQGYDVREEHIENKIKLVLVRTAY